MQHKEGVLGTFVLGDLNVHTTRWLVHSARESAEGRLMAEASRRLGLRQLVNQPTRGKYLLDVVLTDVPDCKASPHSAVADHKSVVTTVAFKVPETASHTGNVAVSRRGLGQANQRHSRIRLDVFAERTAIARCTHDAGEAIAHR